MNRLRSKSINRIRLEFKAGLECKTCSAYGAGINRIRLEFKVYHLHTTQEPEFCINRIRLEFKAAPWPACLAAGSPVLIESDWNLKPVKNHSLLFRERY